MKPKNHAGFAFVVLLAALLALAGQASALNVIGHEITIDVDKAGYANFTEHYRLGFEHSFELEQFKASATENGPSLMAWTVDYDFFYPHFGEGTGNRLKESYVGFDDASRTLSLEYSLAGPFAKIVSDEPRATIWEIPDNELIEYMQGGIIVIPRATTIKISPPSSAEMLEGQLYSEAKIEGGTILLSGISTNFISIMYKISKPIAPSVNSYRVLDFLTAPENSAIVTALSVATVILLAVLFIYRGRITAGIEDYIIEHSEIEHKEPEEGEIELDA
ncbi:MAG: hypothetical protein ABH854_05160 [Candidatus Diapherotrites archaeon]|nr:hypothetical protein [Candidatus Micrarchaeota archaeon]MBU1939549.1 hypothetical protein [Candidatus Micrarchaeota archaeon]